MTYLEFLEAFQAPEYIDSTCECMFLLNTVYQENSVGVSVCKIKT